MKRTNKVALALVAVLVSLSFTVSACGTRKSAPKTANSSPKLAPYQIAFMYLNVGPVQKDLPLVEAALNKITRAKFNATVRLLPVSIAQYNSKLHIMLDGGQKLDVVMAGDNNGISSLVSQGLLLPLDNLMNKYGPGISRAYAENGLTDFLKAGSLTANAMAFRLSGAWRRRTASRSTRIWPTNTVST